MAISTNSCNNTPQAVNDYYYGYNENWSSLIFFDVMANDLGGKAKTLYSLDNGTTTRDLLVADTARTESMSNDYSKFGAKIWITSGGKVGYDVNTLNFQNTIQSLASGEHLTDIFTYAIRLGNGTLSWATTYIDFVGLNDAPVILSGNFSGSVLEQNPAAPNLMANGLINFKDVDLSDTHTISFSPSGSVLGSLSISLLHDTTGSGNSSSGKVSWQYSVSNAAVDYLAAGEIKEDKFNVSISDGHGGVVVQGVKITITGTNDAPIITSPMTSGMGDEQKDPVGDIVVNSSANILFKDVDLSDHHSVSVSANPNNLAGASLAAMLVNDTTGSGMGGQVSWQYSVAASAAEYLAVGESKIEKFTVSISDGHGGIASQEVWITVNGTNDAPMIIDSGSSFAAQVDEMGNPTATDKIETMGVIKFSDVDLIDSHSVSSAASDSNPRLGSLIAIMDADSTGGGMGQISWHYSVDAPKVEYLAEGQKLIESFNVSVMDNNGAMITRQVDITIMGQNDAPVALSDSYSVDEDMVLNVSASAGVLANDTDIDHNDTLTAILVSGPAHGALSLNADGSFSYQAAANYNGPDSFSYKANDSSFADSNIVTVSLTVNPVNDAPFITSNGGSNVASINFAENSTALVTIVQADDPDNHPLATQALTYSIVGGVDMSLFSIDANTGALSFNNAPDYEAPADSNHDNQYLVTVSASDGSLSAEQALTVSVTNVADTIVNNHAPSLTGNFHDFTDNSFKFTVQDQDYAQGDTITANLPANAGLSSSVVSLGNGLFDVTISGIAPQDAVLMSPISVHDSSGATSGAFQLELGTNGFDSLSAGNISDAIVSYGFGDTDVFSLRDNTTTTPHYLLGGDGNDIFAVLFSSSTPTETFTGGSGSDTFSFVGSFIKGFSNGTILSGGVITDFQQGSDKINLNSILIVPVSSPFVLEHVASDNLVIGNDGTNTTISIYNSTTDHTAAHLAAQIMVNGVHNLNIGTDIIL